MLSICHKELALVLSAASASLESLKAAECVERHRMDWRPKVIHTVLLAESHVFTLDSELQPMQGPHHFSTRNLNHIFARFVYCLGYGESEFMGPTGPRTSGTPQYWKLLASCAHPPSSAAFAPYLKGSTPSFLTRLEAKLILLERLHELGVWLIDASAIALYSPGGLRLHHKDYERVLKCCWRSYTGQLIGNASPHSLVVIGKGVAQALSKELQGLSKTEVHCVNQPQGCRAKGEIERVYATLHQVCQQAAYARRAR